MMNHRTRITHKDRADLSRHRFPAIAALPLLFIIILSSCASSTYNLEINVGLYKIIEKDCQLTEGLFNPCDDIKFLEIVQGRFYGVNPDQLALVLWHSGADDSELEYTANLISNHKQVLREKNKLWIVNQKNDDESEQEFFVLKAGKISDYYFHFQRANGADKVISRNFHYKLEPTNRDKENKFKLNYPVD